MPPEQAPGPKTDRASWSREALEAESDTKAKSRAVVTQRDSTRDSVADESSGVGASQEYR
jgi:hypothetical protein